MRAYSSSANLGPGFDVLALAHDAYYDSVRVVHVEPRGTGRVEVSYVGPFSRWVAPGRDTVSRAVRLLLERRGLDVDVVVEVWKGIPVSAGLGGSGASSVAALAAVAEALDLRLSAEEAVLLAGEAEAVSAGSPHYDNVAAAALGGLVVLLGLGRGALRIRRVEVGWLRVVVATPTAVFEKPVEGKTGVMRSVLPEEIKLSEHVAEASSLAALLLGLLEGDWEAVRLGFGASLVDRARSRHVPCYGEVYEELGRRGYPLALSGAGPTLVAPCRPGDGCDAVVEAVKRGYARCGVEAVVKTARPAPGALQQLAG